ncbi:MAG: carbohydrate-binding domain-containing protein, partial [Acutalibacteraceae bacterium]
MKSKKTLSKIVACILSLAMILSLTPSVFAEEFNLSGATEFEFSDSEIKMTQGSEKGYKIEGTALTISDKGTYVLSGSCSDGSVTVKKGTTDVTVVLNGLTLTSSDTAPLTCNKSSAVTIVAAPGTTNTLTDAAYNNDEVYPDNANAENAVIKTKDGSKVTICGTGSININSHGKNGIKSGATTETEGEAWLLIKDVTLNITTDVNDGINAEQLLTIASGNITVDAADDGIHSDLIMDIGAQETDGPVINITKSYEGIEAATLNVYSGNITIHSSDDCMNASNADLTGYAFSINIAGGKLYMDTTAGDGIDSNGSLTISGGTTEVWTANTADNEPLDADKTVSITGGTVFAAGGSSGMGIKLSADQPCVIFGSGKTFGLIQIGNQSSVDIKAGSEITLKDSSGNALYSATTPV